MRRAVTLLELVIVIVILALIAILAMPRHSEASVANPDHELRSQLQLLRVAIERYQQEHNGRLPGADDCNAATVARQLLGSNDGPYLREIPVNPLAPAAYANLLSTDPSSTAGWIYDCETGYVVANVNGVDATGQPYRAY